MFVKRFAAYIVVLACDTIPDSHSCYSMSKLIPHIHCAALVVLIAFALSLSCSEEVIDNDRPRQMLGWNFPDEFGPSHVTVDEDSVRWGLFVSKRFSAKDNLWAVKSRNGGEWQDPLLLMNAYYSENLIFDVSDDTIRLEFTGIDESYFWDYGEYLSDTVPFPETVMITLPLVELLKDYDRDGIHDRLESELLLSTRLPDSDIDGKPDNVDFCPLAKAVEHNERFDIYRETIAHILRLDDPSKMQPKEDTAWTRHYGIFYMYEPTVTYIAMPGEIVMPELLNLPIVTIQARSPLFFTNKRLYTSTSGGVIPHLVLQRPEIDLIGNHASMKISYVSHKHKREHATIHLVEHNSKWEVESVTVEDL